VGVGADAAERDTLRDERLLHAVSLRPRALAGACRLGLQLGAHLAREAGDRTEAEEMRRIALIRAAGTLAVAAHERVLRWRAGAVDAALRMAAEAPEGVRPSGRAQVDATEARREVDRLPVRPAAQIGRASCRGR